MLYLIAFVMFLCEILNIFSYLYKKSFLKVISKYLFFIGSVGLITYPFLFNFGNCPLHTIKGSILIFAFLLDIISLVFIIKYKLDSIISIVSPILGIIIILSFVFGNQNFYIPVKGYDIILKLHIFFSFLAYASFIFSAVASILFLRFYRSLKTKKITEVFKEVPSFPFLEKAMDHATAFGLISITFSILTGFILLKLYYKKLFVFDIEIIGLIILYIVYGIFFILRFIKNINSFTWAKYNIIASLVLLLLFIVGNIFLPGIHSFK